MFVSVQSDRYMIRANLFEQVQFLSNINIILCNKHSSVEVCIFSSTYRRTLNIQPQFSQKFHYLTPIHTIPSYLLSRVYIPDINKMVGIYRIPGRANSTNEIQVNLAYRVESIRGAQYYQNKCSGLVC